MEKRKAPCFLRLESGDEGEEKGDHSSKRRRGRPTDLLEATFRAKNAGKAQRKKMAKRQEIEDLRRERIARDLTSKRTYRPSPAPEGKTEDDWTTRGIDSRFKKLRKIG